MTPSDWEKVYSAGQKYEFPPVGLDAIRERLNLLTDEGYSYFAEYIQICDFLTVWQVSDPGNPNYGGMIEGETGDLVNIIQTDNTQESIRVWSGYGNMTGDIERYRDNVDAAWTYTMNFPAYSEEGETDYYRVHNCGWGLVAQMEYLDVYSDPQYTEYADSCADYIITHPLSFYTGSSYYQQLHPLVTGWAAGTLYQYGNYVGNQAYIDTAVVFGQRVIDWIEENPQRLNSNEVWAMSGGTAMWGVVNSVFQEDSLTGVNWLDTYAEYMDLWSGPGTWNNSWNIWYANAHRSIYDLTADPSFEYNAIFLVDTLLFQDTDNDGGIPAGSADPDTMDQTWVSCYTDYMGIEKILATLNTTDAGVFGFANPLPEVPIPMNSQITFEPIAVNYGSLVLGDVDVFTEIDGSSFGTGVAQLTTFALDTVETSPSFLAADPGFFTLSAFTSLPGDQDTSNDTAYIEVEVRANGELSGAVTDIFTGEGIYCELYFYHQEVSNAIPFATTTTSLPDGNYSLDLMAGEYRIEAMPVIPYNNIEFYEIEVLANQATIYNMELDPADILLVDDDQGMAYDTFIVSSLNNLYVEPYHWERDINGELNGNTQLFDMCIWFTGDDDTTTLTQADKDELVLYLESGGNLILSGQNIGEDLGMGDSFLNNYMKVEHETDDINQYFLDGVTGNEISEGTTLFLIGSGGAGNQNSPSTCTALPGGEVCYQYQNTPNPVGVVTYNDPTYGYHSVFMSLGLEGISGMAGTTSRADLLTNIFEWWGYTVKVEENLTLLPGNFQLMTPFPNPFNPVTNIVYNLSKAGIAELSIYNIVGQQIVTLWSGKQEAGYHRFTWEGTGNASGIYYCLLNFNGEFRIQPLVLIK